MGSWLANMVDRTLVNRGCGIATGVFDRFHGGMSTGPKTKAGRAKIADAQRRRWGAFRSRSRGLSQIIE
jgi:hypothetical protein